MRRTLQVVLPFVILVFSGLLIYWIISNKEVPERRQFTPPSPQVVVTELQPEDFQITLHSQGTVTARTESSLIAEVRGRIVSISSNFQEGAFFEEGDVLLEIDDRDYQSELKVAEAALAQAELAFMQEAARYEQARRDWERLNPGVEATELTLREPQYRQANANAESARARVESAKLNLERTKVKAPYSGRILTKNVDLGQFVSTGNVMALIYAVDYAEVRLPLTASQFGYLNLPSIYRGANPSIENGPKVTLISTVAGRSFSWEGRVVRSEGSVDTRTRQVFVVAQVADPYGATVPGRPPLKVGTFVEAEIEGATLKNVFVVPRKLYRENSYVLVVDDAEFLQRRPVDVVWDNDEHIIVNGGLGAGELLCMTDVPYALEGLQVATRGESEAPRSMAGGGMFSARVDAIIAAVGERMPANLKSELLACKEKEDWQGLREAMTQVSEWAKTNGVELPSGGPNPRS